MAKVMISIPDALLGRIDARAEDGGETRSGFLQRLAEQELAAAEMTRREDIERLLDLATEPMGGEAARLIREDRDAH